MGDVHQVDDRRVELPVLVRDAAIGGATYLADWDAVRHLLPEGLEPVRVAPRRTLALLVMADYRDNDLGDYDEVAIQFPVTRPGRRRQLQARGDMLRGRVTTWPMAMPVNQEFTLLAGRQIWGFPKTLDDVHVEIGPERARCVWRADGELVLTLSVPTGRGRAMPTPPLQVWTQMDGRLHVTDFVMEAQHGRIGVGGATLELGTHPVAKELARLGLSRRAIMTTWMDDATASFGAPVAR